MQLSFFVKKESFHYLRPKSSVVDDSQNREDILHKKTSFWQKKSKL